MTKRFYAGRWPRVRLQILERDGWLCMIRGPGCTIRATEVDHILPILQGGEWYEPSNLRAACKGCNLRRIGQHGSRRWMSANTYITLVVGPPGTDLLAYVRTHAQPTDLIIDQGVMTRALGQGQAATSARNNLLDQLRRAKINTPRAWITSHNPIAESLFPYHKAVVLNAQSQADTLTQSGADQTGHPTPASEWHSMRSGTGTAAATASRAW